MIIRSEHIQKYVLRFHLISQGQKGDEGAKGRRGDSGFKGEPGRTGKQISLKNSQFVIINYLFKY